MGNNLVCQFTQRLRKKIYNDDFKNEYRASEKWFTRNRGTILSCFANIIIMILSGLECTLRSEIDWFLDVQLPLVRVVGFKNVTIQAFCKARLKIKSSAFKEILNITNLVIYDKMNGKFLKTFKGFFLFGIDGSVYELENHKGILKHFGGVSNQSGTSPRAQVSAIFDLLNNHFIDAVIKPYKTAEKNFILGHWNVLKSLNIRKSIMIFDRGYPSRDLMANFIDGGQKFLIRVNSSFLLAVNNANKPDQWVNFKYNGKTYKVRVVNVVLKNGTVEKLLTNLTEKEMAYEDFAELYFYRWGIETAYKKMKYTVDTEAFSGVSVQAIEQDFYASFVRYNVANMAKIEVEYEAEKRGKNNKKQGNTNKIYGKTIDHFIRALLTKTMNKAMRMICKIFSDIYRQIKEFMTDIRPGRSFERKFHKRTGIKYPMCKRRAR